MSSVDTATGEATRQWVADYAERMNVSHDACKTVAQYVWTVGRSELRDKVLALCEAMEDGYLDVSDFAIQQIRATVNADDPVPVDSKAKETPK